MPQDVTHASFADMVLAASHKKPVLVYFWASWCAPCRLLSPILEAMVGKAHGRWQLCKVATEGEPDLCSACDVSSLPAVQLYMHATLVAEFVDLLPEAELTEWLEASIAAAMRSP